jgi:DNA-binding NtrC family response regulator
VRQIEDRTYEDILMAAILIVDDDELIRDALSQLFESEHRCHVAETADQAVAWLESESYDVVLTDISMPGLSGLELLAHLREVHPDTSVIVISGIGDKGHAEGLLKLGAFDYLLKPFHLANVEASVSLAIEHHRRLVRMRQRSAGSNEPVGRDAPGGITDE